MSGFLAVCSQTCLRLKNSFSLRSVSLLAAFAWIVALLLVSPSAQAQVSASISGRVTDPTGAVVSGADVSVKDLETDVTRTTTTDAGGRYAVVALPVGVYEVRVAKQSFQAMVQSGIRLAVGQDATVDAALHLGQVSDQLVVNTDAPIVNVTTADVSGVVGEQQVTDLPLNGRSYDELMTLNPGVLNFTWMKTGGIGVSNSTAGNMFSVAGNRPQQNMFLLNGVEFTGAAENNMQPGGTSQQLLGVDAIREFNILQNAYGAEYGKHPGGQVTIVTRGGSNEWHGSGFEFLRNSAFDAPNFFDQGAAPPFHRNQFGGSLGGPVQKDKTFFFVNYEGFRQRLDQTSVAFVPDAAARSGSFTPLGSACALAVRPACIAEVNALLNLWPIANGPDQGSGIAEFFGTPLQTIREDFGTARVDHVFSAKDTLSASYTNDDSADNTATAINPYMSDVTSLREQVFSLEETHVFSPSLLNTARVGFSRAGYYFTGATTQGTPAASTPAFLPGLPYVGAVVVGGSAASNPAAQVALAGSNNGSNLSIHRNIFTYEDQASWIKGRQSFKFGVWFQRFQSNENIALSQYGQATFPSLTNFLQGTFGTGSFLIDPSSTPLSWRSLYGAFFVEDVIRLTSRLTVSLGFRDEFSTGWNEAYGRASNYGFTNGVINTQPTIGNSLFSINNAKFLPQPRIGIAWSPMNKTVIRASFGMYNDLQDALGYRADQNAPYNPSYSVPNLTLNQFPLPTTIVAASQGTASPAGTKLVPGGVQPDMQTPTLISYSLKLEREITPNTSVTIGYLGSHGYHELVGADGNIPPTVTCPVACNRANNSIANTWTWFSEGDSLYNAMVVDVNHRFGGGLTFRGSYTWSKALDDGDSLNATAAANAPALLSNPTNPKADWGPATFDVRNVGVISVSYALPVGQGKHFMNRDGWANNVLGGWTANSIVTVQGGFPLTPQLSFNPTNDGDSRNPVRPSWNPAFTGNPLIGSASQWFNPSAFIVPAAGTFGNVGRDVLPGPGLATWDFSALKDIRLTEKFRVQFRAELFNMLNRTNFGVPNLIVFTSASSAPSPVAGTFTYTSTTARQVQFALKLLW